MASGSSEPWARPELVQGVDHVQRALHEIEASSSSSVDIFVSGVSRLITAEGAERRLLERGLPVRCLYEKAFAQDPNGARYMGAWAELGEQQCVVSKVPFRGAIVDQATVLVPIDVVEDKIRSLLVVRSGLAIALVQVFELLWLSRGDDPVVQPARSFRAEELAVLRLLCRGLSDHQIARELGLSARTVQRRLRAAATNLGVTSRASLAAHAVALGLVKIPDP